jgi:DNA repair exonuclease SbcCD ATPase subunit
MDSQELKSLKELLDERHDQRLDEIMKTLNNKPFGNIVNITTMLLLLVGLIGSFITAYINLDKSISILDLETKRLGTELQSIREDCNERSKIVNQLERDNITMKYHIDALIARGKRQ